MGMRLSNWATVGLLVKLVIESREKGKRKKTYRNYTHVAGRHTAAVGNLLLEHEEWMAPLFIPQRKVWSGRVTALQDEGEGVAVTVLSYKHL